MRFLAAALFACTLVPALPGPARAAAEAMCDSPPCTRAEIEQYEKRVIRHLLRVQQDRFEADARGDTKRWTRYDREFKRTVDRRVAARQAMEHATD